jgi:hypothetical protein
VLPSQRGVSGRSLAAGRAAARGDHFPSGACISIARMSLPARALEERWPPVLVVTAEAAMRENARAGRQDGLTALHDDGAVRNDVCPYEPTMATRLRPHADGPQNQHAYVSFSAAIHSRSFLFRVQPLALGCARASGSIMAYAPAARINKRGLLFQQISQQVTMPAAEQRQPAFALQNPRIRAPDPAKFAAWRFRKRCRRPFGAQNAAARSRRTVFWALA